MLDVSRLRLLAELRRHGTMGAVAEALSYSTSAVSQQLTKLQSEVGAPLYHRVGRRLELTPAGELLADEADIVLEAVERAQSAIDNARGEAGTVRLGVVPTIAWTTLGDIMSVVERDHPALRMSVSTYEPESGSVALANRNLDIMLMDEYRGMPRKRQSGLVRVPLMRDPIRAVLPAGLPAETDPAALDWVFESFESEAARWALAICREQGIEPTVRYYTPDIALQRKLVQDGLAAAFLPDIIRRDGHGYRAVPGFPDDLYRTLYAVTRTGSSKRASVQTVVGVLRSCISARSEAHAA